MRTWSKYQKAIFAFAEDKAAGNLIVEAVAGSGKTTTLVEMVKRLTGSHIFLAFNKSIATELSTRGVNARTFHSLTFSPVKQFTKFRNVDTGKLQGLVKANMSGDNAYIYGAFMCRLVGLARQAGIGCLIEDTEQAWFDIVEHHDLDIDSEKGNVAEGVAFARKLLQWSNEAALRGIVDFDDLLYICVKEGLPLPKFPNVLIDELQDTNAIQCALVRKLLLPQTRVFGVGDPMQAIYGFRGADCESMSKFGAEFNCKTLPLSVSYRCSKAVIEYAKQFCPHIEAAEDAIEGAVIEMGDKWTVKELAVNDMVVCRTTKPLITLGYKMLKARMPVRIMGREIGEGLIALIEKMNAKGIDALITKLDAWRVRETEKAVAKNQDGKAASIEDKADAIVCLIDGLTENERTVPALIQVIRDLFADKNNVTTLATIHKAKGLEATRVFWLNRSKCPSSWARMPWQQKEENHLCVVASTRSKDTLVIIEEPEERAA